MKATEKNFLVVLFIMAAVQGASSFWICEWNLTLFKGFEIKNIPFQSSTRLRSVPSKKAVLKTFEQMPFRWGDSLDSCGRKADTRKKFAVQKYLDLWRLGLTLE